MDQSPSTGLNVGRLSLVRRTVGLVVDLVIMLVSFLLGLTLFEAGTGAWFVPAAGFALVGLRAPAHEMLRRLVRAWLALGLCMSAVFHVASTCQCDEHRHPSSEALWWYGFVWSAVTLAAVIGGGVAWAFRRWRGRVS